MGTWAGPRYRQNRWRSLSQNHLLPPRRAWNLPKRGQPQNRASAPTDKVAELPRVPVKRDERLQALEAILFLAREPLNARKLGQHANLADGTEALTLIRRLNELYETEGRAFRVEQVAGGYQLMTHPTLADWLRRLAGTPPEVRLSTPAMETLTVVAYRQPVQRADVEAIRGVACGEMLRQLMDRDLVRIAGRSEELGRPFLYGTTNHFLHIFGLGGIDELPRAESLRQPLGPPSNLNGSEDKNTEDNSSENTDLETKENDKVTATIGEIHEEVLDSTALSAAAGTPGVLTSTTAAVASIDDDDLEDDFDDDDEDDDEDDDFDDDFDDDDEDEEWDDELDDDLDDDELDDDEADDDADDEEDEWEEVEDDEEDELDDDDDDDDEDDDDDDDWEEDDD